MRIVTISLLFCSLLLAQSLGSVERNPHAIMIKQYDNPLVSNGVYSFCLSLDMVPSPESQPRMMLNFYFDSPELQPVEDMVAVVSIDGLLEEEKLMIGQATGEGKSHASMDITRQWRSVEPLLSSFSGRIEAPFAPYLTSLIMISHSFEYVDNDDECDSVIGPLHGRSPSPSHAPSMSSPRPSMSAPPPPPPSPSRSPLPSGPPSSGSPSPSSGSRSPSSGSRSPSTASPSSVSPSRQSPSHTSVRSRSPSSSISPLPPFPSSWFEHDVDFSKSPTEPHLPPQPYIGYGFQSDIEEELAATQANTRSMRSSKWNDPITVPISVTAVPSEQSSSSSSSITWLLIAICIGVGVTLLVILTGMLVACGLVKVILAQSKHEEIDEEKLVDEPVNDFDDLTMYTTPLPPPPVVAEDNNWLSMSVLMIPFQYLWRVSPTDWIHLLWNRPTQ